MGVLFLIQVIQFNARPQVPNVVRDAKTSGGRFWGAVSRAERGCDLIEVALTTTIAFTLEFYSRA